MREFILRIWIVRCIANEVAITGLITWSTTAEVRTDTLGTSLATAVETLQGEITAHDARGITEKPNDLIQEYIDKGGGTDSGNRASPDVWGSAGGVKRT